ESAALEAAVKRRIVDERVDAAKGVERRARHLHCRGGARNIELRASRGTLFAPHEIEGLRAIVDIGDHDTGAEARKVSRIFLSDAARGAGDHNDFSFDVHRVTASAGCRAPWRSSRLSAAAPALPDRIPPVRRC